ncbi:hypothetical protein ACFL02_06935, partial [Planctomycetota bacterium]
MKYKIIPYTCAGPISFGMTKKEVRLAVGKPLRVSKTYFGIKTFIYEELNVGFSKSSGLVNHLGFNESSDIYIGRINVFKEPNAFKKLLSIDGDPYEHVGFIVLLNLGISLTGFHNKDDKTIAAFAKGENDDIMQKGKPLNLSRLRRGLLIFQHKTFF